MNTLRPALLSPRGRRRGPNEGPEEVSRGYPRRILPLRTLVAGLVVLGALRLASAQVRRPGSSTLGQDSGPVSEVSRSLGSTSRSVHEGSRTIGEGTSRSMKSGPVRDPGTRSMKSGTFSDISRGPSTRLKPVTGAGSIGSSSAGSVKMNIDEPIGQRISDPLRELTGLQEQLRARATEADGGRPPVAAAGTLRLQKPPAPPSQMIVSAPNTEGIAEDSTGGDDGQPEAADQPGDEPADEGSGLTEDALP